MQIQLHNYYTTLHCTNYIALHYNYNCNCNYNYHYIALRYTTPITNCMTLHYNYTYTTLHYATLDLQYATHQYTALHYTNYTTLQLQRIYTLHYNYNSTTLHYNYNCTTPHYIQQLWWGDYCNHFQKHNSNHLFGPSVDSLCHPWFTATNLSYRFLFLKLPPPPCAVYW